MKKLMIVVLLLSLMTLFSSCSKDEEVAELEKEVQQAEATDYLAEDDTEPAMEPAMTDSEPVDDYAATPETTPVAEETVTTSDYEGSGGYTVQIASGGNYEYVNELLQKYLDRGYDAFISETYIDNEAVYRLRIGNYAGLSEAQAMGVELQDKFSIDFWIDNN